MSIDYCDRFPECKPESNLHVSLHGVYFVSRSYDTLDNSVFAADSHHGDELRVAFAAGRRTPQPIDPLARSKRFDSRSVVNRQKAGGHL